MDFKRSHPRMSATAHLNKTSVSSQLPTEAWLDVPYVWMSAKKAGVGERREPGRDYQCPLWCHPVVIFGLCTHSTHFVESGGGRRNNGWTVVISEEFTNRIETHNALKGMWHNLRGSQGKIRMDSAWPICFLPYSLHTGHFIIQEQLLSLKRLRNLEMDFIGNPACCSPRWPEDGSKYQLLESMR